MNTRLTAVLLGSLMLISMVPTTQAETLTDEYDATLGVRVMNTPSPREGLTLSWDLSCVDGVVIEDSCEVSSANIGGGQLSSDLGDVYSNVVVSTADDNFDNPYTVACVVVQSGEVLDNICDDDGDDFRADGCGSVSLTTPGPLFGGHGGEQGGNPVVMFVSTVVVQADTLEVCAGSSGTLVGVFS